MRKNHSRDLKHNSAFNHIIQPIDEFEFIWTPLLFIMFVFFSLLSPMPTANYMKLYVPHERQIVLVSVLALSVNGQKYQDARTAAIISEQRYLSGDGKFGSAYTQEDGTDFKEETDADGTRHGSYSYIDPNGQKRSITYTAGKNG